MASATSEGLAEQGHDGGLLRQPAPADIIELAPEFGTRFTLFIDTEEEFDWDGPFQRTGHSVTIHKGLADGQRFLNNAGLRPIYVTDYPVLENSAAMDLMRDWVAKGQADVGAHLHPWVNPPHVEEPSLKNSYVGFLPEELERAKLFALRDKITENFGKPPRAYRAGRYGVGPASAALLEEAGFLLDTSVRSRFDYRHQFGPDFYDLPLHPYWAGPTRSLIELPLSTAFTGVLRGMGALLYRSAQDLGRLPGALSKSGLLTRVPLTPEGIPSREAVQAIDALLEANVRVLNLSFHSPSLEPGHTPYVRDAADLRAFYGWWDTVLAHLDKRGVRPAALDDVLAAVPERTARISTGSVRPLQAA